MPTLILASASPRRRQLLQLLGLPFTVRVADIDESALPDEEPVLHARRLAESKARVVVAKVGTEEAVVIAADTIVVHKERILGKPKNAREARSMLQSLRDTPHQVITAVAVATTVPPRLISTTHTSLVTMRPYSDAEIEAYIATNDPLDKAGAYAIQHPDFRPVAHYEGCFASIMGLPLGVVADILQALNLHPQPDWPQRCQRLSGRCCRLA
ncbi:MAG: septum formation protein Maf [Chloroflexi bacterium]|nr:septum formation protein Maf [Chloroflexota bacterium]